MIVKNEELVLCRCLDSVKNLMDEIKKIATEARGNLNIKSYDGKIYRLECITDIIDERHLWRTSMPIRTVYLMFGAITFVGVTWIVQAVLKVM